MKFKEIENLNKGLRKKKGVKHMRVSRMEGGIRAVYAQEKQATPVVMTVEEIVLRITMQQIYITNLSALKEYGFLEA